MVHIHCTPHKSTRGRLTVGQLAPHGTLRKQEESVEPQLLLPIVTPCFFEKNRIL
jgi:hypothetical protein